MTVYIALLRGINVGGNKKVPMKELAQLFTAAACENVATYIQSGNVVFSSAASKETLQPELYQAIEKHFGFTVALIMRSLEEWRAVVAANPFTTDNPKMLHVFLLDAIPDPKLYEAFLQLERNGEEIALTGTSLYFYTPNGFGTSKLANVIERKLKVSMTARNWNTMLKLLEMGEKLA